MKQYKQSLWALLILFTLTACKKEPFEGIDNYMLDFRLETAAAETFGGEISENIIKVNIPANIETDKLTAKYTISELAVISPAPETIKDWGSDRNFTITSYNGTQREYTVKITKTDVIAGESVFLRTDEDVASFAARKIDIINGDLIIGAPNGPDSISTIDALDGLKEVRYKLVVNTTYKGADLKGLKKIRKAGDISINGEFKELTKIEFPELEKIASGLSVISRKTTEVLLPKLSSAENIRLKLPRLAKFDLSRLKKISELEIKGCFECYEQDETTLENIRLPELISGKKIHIDKFSKVKEIDLSNLETCSVYFYVNNTPEMKTLKLDRLKNVEDWGITFSETLEHLNFPALEEAGTLKIEKNDMLKTISMPNLKTINNLLFISGPSISDISSINKLENAKSVLIQNSSKLSSVKSLSANLKTVENFTLYGLPLIEDIDLSRVSIKGDLRLLNCPKIKSVKLPENIGKMVELNLASDETVTNLPQITGLKECTDFQISNAPGLKEVVLPSSLEKINGQLYINGGAISISGENLQETGSFNISANDLKSLFFPRLEKVSNKLSLFGKFLEKIHLPKIISVGNLEIGGSYAGWQNEKLTNLDFLSTLTSVTAVEIKFCKYLTDYSGLKKAVDSGSINKNNWMPKSIHDNAYNPTFEDLKAGRYVKP